MPGRNRERLGTWLGFTPDGHKDWLRATEITREDQKSLYARCRKGCGKAALTLAIRTYVHDRNDPLVVDRDIALLEAGPFHDNIAVQAYLSGLHASIGSVSKADRISTELHKNHGTIFADCLIHKAILFSSVPQDPRLAASFLDRAAQRGSFHAKNTRFGRNLAPIPWFLRRPLHVAFRLSYAPQVLWVALQRTRGEPLDPRLVTTLRWKTHRYMPTFGYPVDDPGPG